MPVNRKRTYQTMEDEEQERPIAVPGSKQLKESRLKLVKTSLRCAKLRLVERKKKIAHMEKHWHVYEEGKGSFYYFQFLSGFNRLFDTVSDYTESASTMGDIRPLSYITFSPDGTELATSSWSGDCKVYSFFFFLNQ